MVCGPALEAGTRRKIVGADGLIIAVGQRCSGWSIASALLPVAFPAFQLGEELFPVLDAIQGDRRFGRSEEHTSELQSHSDVVCRLLLEKKIPTTLCHAVRSFLIPQLIIRY